MRDFFHKKHDDHAHTVPGYRSFHAEGSEKQNTRARLKCYLKVTTIGITFLGTLGLLFLHPFFQIRAMQIHGTQRINEGDIRDTVNGILSYKRFFIFPQNNFFIIDINDLHTILAQKFPLKNLVIRKSFPHRLDITVDEKLSSIIYDNGQQYSLIEENGKVSEVLRIIDDSEWRVIKKHVTSTSSEGVEVSTDQIVSRFHTPNYKKIVSEVGDYPLVYDTRGKQTTKGEQILDQQTVKNIIAWYETLKRNSDVPITYFYLEKQVGDVTIKTSEGWSIKAKLDDTTEEQFQTLQYILKQKVQRPNIEYIDVRFPGRAFWL